MPINNQELIKAISIVADNSNVRVCVRQSLKGALVCGGMSLIGGIVLGPVGLAVGGTVGGLTAYSMTSGTFRPLGEILMTELTETQQEALIRHINAAVADVGVTDLALLIPLLARSTDIQSAVLQTVATFVKNELRMQIID